MYQVGFVDVFFSIQSIKEMAFIIEKRAENQIYSRENAENEIHKNTSIQFGFVDIDWNIVKIEVIYCEYFNTICKYNK